MSEKVPGKGLPMWPLEKIKHNEAVVWRQPAREGYFGTWVQDFKFTTPVRSSYKVAARKTSYQIYEWEWAMHTVYGVNEALIGYEVIRFKGKELDPLELLARIKIRAH